MLIIPMKWVPYLLVLVGFVLLVRPISDDEVIGGLLMLVVGGIWLYLRHSGKSKSSTEKSTDVSNQ